MDYEIVIPAAPKDYNKLPFLIKSINDYIWPRPKGITIIHAGGLDPFWEYPCTTVITSIYEKNVLNLNSTQATNFRRPQWIYQQFLKLFQNVTETNKYLILDSDIIINKELHVFHPSDRKPFFFMGIDQNHPPYFKLSKTLFDVGREHDHSFISEIMLFDKEYCNLMLKVFYAFYIDPMVQSGTFDLNQLLLPEDKEIISKIENPELRGREKLLRMLYNTVCLMVQDDFLIADYELYGNFIKKYFPKDYHFKDIKSNLSGKYSSWTDEEIKIEVDKMAKTSYDVFTLHTWI